MVLIFVYLLAKPILLPTSETPLTRRGMVIEGKDFYFEPRAGHPLECALYVSVQEDVQEPGEFQVMALRLIKMGAASSRFGGVISEYIGFLKYCVKYIMMR